MQSYSNIIRIIKHTFYFVVHHRLVHELRGGRSHTRFSSSCVFLTVQTHTAIEPRRTLCRREQTDSSLSMKACSCHRLWSTITPRATSRMQFSTASIQPIRHQLILARWRFARGHRRVSRWAPRRGVANKSARSKRRTPRPRRRNRLPSSPSVSGSRTREGSA